MKIDIQDKKGLAFFFGLLIIVFSVIFRSNPILITNPNQVVVMFIVNIAIRILAVVFCANIAEELNRSSFGWGFFAFFFPQLALMVIAFVRIKRKEEKIEIENINVSLGIKDDGMERFYDIDFNNEDKSNKGIDKINNKVSLIDGYLARGNMNFIQLKYSDAIKDFSTVIVLDPLNGEAYYLRGLSEIALNQMGSANSDFIKSKELGFENAEIALVKYYK